MTGDAGDFLRRLKAVLPSAWFADSTPILDGVLSGAADAWATLYELLQYVVTQTRISSATGQWLDFVAADFFGGRLRRGAGEGDSELRDRIDRRLNRQRVTRGAMIANLVELTGRQPVIVEPANPNDTGVWGCAMGWGVAGVWGSMTMPQQVFVAAFRPDTAGYVAADSDIVTAVLDAVPVAVTPWINIQN